MCWTQAQITKGKDLSAIVTPWLVALLTLGVGVWLQLVTASRAADQKNLELAVSILRTPLKDDPTGNLMKNWAIDEFEKQTGTHIPKDVRDAIRQNPTIFAHWTGIGMYGQGAVGGYKDLSKFGQESIEPPQK